MEKIEIKTEVDIVFARQSARNLAEKHGFSIMGKTRIATAVSELARNVFVHAGGGYMEFDVITDGDLIGVQCIFIDSGPGIADIDLAMADGFTTNNSLGQGLPGSKRLVDRFTLKSSPLNGTRVDIVKWK